MKNGKKWGCACLALTLAALILFGGLTAVIDPLFHYHKPLAGLGYSIWDERYQNDGIVKHFDYDALITGSSMCENFKTSEMDTLFGTNAIKVCYSGSSYRELCSNLRRAADSNDQLRTVLMGLDLGAMLRQWDDMRSDVPYPDYLYDDVLLNDVSYLLNKEILLRYTVRTLQHTFYGFETTSFDDYSAWNGEFGAQAVMKEVVRGPAAQQRELTEQEAQMVRENIRRNVVELAEANPQITFHCFIPPYSIVYWDIQNRGGDRQVRLDTLRIATEELLSCENIRLYAFWEEPWCLDLDNYSDYFHYGPWINSQILQKIHNNENRITRENADKYWDGLERYFRDFDYDGYFAKLEAEGNL